MKFLLACLSTLALTAWAAVGILKYVLSQKFVAFADEEAKKRLYDVFSLSELNFDWLRRVGFEPVGVLHGFHDEPFVIAWKLSHERTYFGMTVAKGRLIANEF